MKRILVTGLLSATHPLTQSVLDLYRHVDHSIAQWDFLFAAKQEDVASESFALGRDEIESYGGRVFTLDYKRGKWNNAQTSAFTAFLADHPDICGCYHCALNIFDVAPARIAHKVHLPLTAIHAYAPFEMPPDKSTRRTIGNTRGALTREGHLLLATSPEVGKATFGSRAMFETLRFGVDLKGLTFDLKRRKKFRKKHKWNESVPIVGMVGSFYRVKDIIFALRAFECLRMAMPEVRMVYLAQGNVTSLEEYIAERGLAEYVHILTDETDTPGFYSAIDALMVPVRTNVIPHVAIEAQAGGLPVILPDHVEESVRVTQTARPVPFFDYVRHPWQWGCELAEALRGRNERTLPAEIMAHQGFDVHACAARVDELFAERLGTRRNRKRA